MRLIRITIILSLYFFAIVFIIMSCGMGQGMMNDGWSISMINWNWTPILIVIGLGLIISWLIFRSKK